MILLFVQAIHPQSGFLLYLAHGVAGVHIQLICMVNIRADQDIAVRVCPHNQLLMKSKLYAIRILLIFATLTLTGQSKSRKQCAWTHRIVQTCADCSWESLVSNTLMQEDACL